VDQHRECRDLLESIWMALGGAPERPAEVVLAGTGSAASPFAVTDLAQAAVAAAGLALAELIAAQGAAVDQPAAPGPWPEVRVDRALAEDWFRTSIRPLGWTLPANWDAVAGDYRTADGWIRLHTNAPRHKAATLAVLSGGGQAVTADRDVVAAAVAGWKADELEARIVAAGGAAAAMRSTEAWAEHPQGRAVAIEPVVHCQSHPLPDAPSEPSKPPFPNSSRPLAGVKVLDLTRVLAGPVSTRFLAGWGAEVLRIDPLDWDEPPLVPDVTVGKRCARLDLRTPAARQTVLDLLASADVIVHGYRPGAVDGLGLGEDVRRAVRPDVVDVSLDAYGWSGPWAGRRGFDSLLQMSSGIAEAGMQAVGADHPVPLPFQALDHATGYLLAAAALRGLTLRLVEGRATTWRASLARTAALFISTSGRAAEQGADPEPAPQASTPAGTVEHTVWGDLERLPSPVTVGGAGLAWTSPPRPLGTDEACWAGASGAASSGPERT
jgi:CoA-transferase family III